LYVYIIFNDFYGHTCFINIEEQICIGEHNDKRKLFERRIIK